MNKDRVVDTTKSKYNLCLKNFSNENMLRISGSIITDCAVEVKSELEYVEYKLKSLFSMSGITKIKVNWMLPVIKSNIFKSNIEAIINMVNGVGIMGSELLFNLRNVVLIFF